jgi:uncharacterized protein (TIGR00269 family)
MSSKQHLNDNHFIVEVEKKVKKTIKDYKLLKPKDKLVVALSGGKDSFVLLHILKKLGYVVEALTLDMGVEDGKKIQDFCKKLGVKLHFFSFEKIYGCSISKLYNQLVKKGVRLGKCTVCGVLRRKFLNMLACKIGATKVATGHNLDDEAQTILMNLLKNKLDVFVRLGPKSGIKQEANFVQRIKPLYFIHEKEIERYSRIHNFNVKYTRHPCSFGSTRHALRDFFADYEKIRPCAKQNLVSWFLKTLPGLREKIKLKKQITLCNLCGEPTSNKVCRACQILSYAKGASKSA